MATFLLEYCAVGFNIDRGIRESTKLKKVEIALEETPIAVAIQGGDLEMVKIICERHRFCERAFFNFILEEVFKKQDHKIANFIIENVHPWRSDESGKSSDYASSSDESEESVSLSEDEQESEFLSRSWP